MSYGNGAKVGNRIVFSREGAIKAYSDFCKLFAENISIEASVICSNAMLDMMKLGFTPEELEAIEIME